MSTEETSTEETPTEETVEASEETKAEASSEIKDPLQLLGDLQQAEVKIHRFSRLRDILITKDKEWAEEQTEKRKTLLEEAGLLETFKELDEEAQQHRAQFKANVDPIIACIKILSDYRMTKLNGGEWQHPEMLSKVWAFEQQLFKDLDKAQASTEDEIDADAETEDQPQEKNEEKSEE